MMEVLKYKEFKNQLKSSLDRVCNDEEVIVVSLHKNKNAVVISLNEYNAIKETMHLLSTEKNRKRLLESITEMQKEKFSLHSLIKD